MSSDITLKVFDVIGNEITTLVDEYKPAGTYEANGTQINFQAEYISTGYRQGVLFKLGK